MLLVKVGQRFWQAGKQFAQKLTAQLAGYGREPLSQVNFHESFEGLKVLAKATSYKQQAPLQYFRANTLKAVEEISTSRCALTAIKEIEELFPQLNALPLEVTVDICAKAKVHALLQPPSHSDYFSFTPVSEALEQSGVPPVKAHAIAVKYTEIVDAATDKPEYTVKEAFNAVGHHSGHHTANQTVKDVHHLFANVVGVPHIMSDLSVLDGARHVGRVQASPGAPLIHKL